ncbi:hypothetical protein KL905_002797 [Ogataea polymorpha]|uniref:Uncharacterized protein n=1 Tax=Ogataea polymorpha TaxID=460523 RepID=A0A9P8NTB5_9ASCO|nr:hypothetical protein KL937_002355 [Ogataea polymorpha]KAG7893218.1 hypothetical protein KL908_002951 [Ogataea polymorpha]KAG7900655.1 hypothetical protein KL935_002588 [Ogataea polymorpha]KAG7905032.1 hypothetical protein KL907_003248 [Ogataea polymorpha]KAG7907848.1 hypothetical protein KL906_003265 [Ogataea polymorpha]
MSSSSCYGRYHGTFATPYEEPSKWTPPSMCGGPLTAMAEFCTLKTAWRLLKVTPLLPSLPYDYTEQRVYSPRFKTLKFTAQPPLPAETHLSYAKKFYSSFYQKRTNSRILNSIALLRKIDPARHTALDLVEDHVQALEFGTPPPTNVTETAKQTARLINSLRLLNLENTLEKNYGRNSEPCLMVQDPDICNDIWTELNFLRTSLEPILNSLLCISDIPLSDSVESLYGH